MQPTPDALLGAPLPDLTLPQLDGGTLRFADLRGTRTVLYFWGSW